jgi:hypothetical protein
MENFHQGLKLKLALPFFIFIILVFTLSKGSDIQDTATPERADETSLSGIVSVFYPEKAMAASLH